MRLPGRPPVTRNARAITPVCANAGSHQSVRRKPNSAKRPRRRPTRADGASAPLPPRAERAAIEPARRGRGGAFLFDAESAAECPPGRSTPAACVRGLGSSGLDLGLLGGHAPTLGAFGQHLGNALDRATLVEFFNRRQLARHPVEGRFVKLPLRIGLLRLALGAIKIAHDLGNRDEIAGVDLGFVFLGPAAPHGALYPRLAAQRLHGFFERALLRQLAHANALRLSGRHAQGHLVLFKGDDEELERNAGDLLLFDADDAANAVRGINDPFVGLEAVTLVYGFLADSLLPRQRG